MCILRTAFLVASILILSNCANMTSVYRELDTSQGKGALIDIKQRAIISGQVVSFDKDGKPVIQYVVCAEPSPDSMSALSASIAGDLKLSESAKLGVASSLQEGAAFVGLRTQSIQLLRDAMYRYCEMYMNGGISKSHYQLLLRRNQRYMVALLAIEQLTGAIKVPTVSISTQGSAQLAKDVSALVEEKTSTKAAISKQNDANKLFVTELSANPPPSDARKTEIASEQKIIKENIDDLNKNLESIEKAIGSARGALAQGSASVVVNNSSLSSRSDSHIKSVADNVTDITKFILETDDFGSMCLISLLNNDFGDDDQGMKKICESRLQNVVDANSNINKLTKKLLQIDPVDNNEKIEKFKKLMQEAMKFNKNTGILNRVIDG